MSVVLAFRKCWGAAIWASANDWFDGLVGLWVVSDGIAEIVRVCLLSDCAAIFQMSFVRPRMGEALTQPEQSHVVALGSIRPIESNLRLVRKAEGSRALGRATRKGCPGTSQGKTLVT